MKKRLFGIILAVCMVLTLLPVTALAAGSGVYVGGVEMADGQYLPNGSSTLQDTEPTQGGWARLAGSTLTLKNYSYDGEGHHFPVAGSFGLASIYADDDLTITLEGASSVTGSEASDLSSFGVYCSRTLTIQGAGTLKAKGGGGDILHSYGIYGSGSVAISGYAIVNATGGNDTGDSYGVYGNSVTITGSATVNATGGNDTGSSYGIYSVGDVVISGSATVNATGGKTVGGDSSGVFSRSSGSVTITENATVNATGGAATSFASNTQSTGVYCSAGVTISGSATVNATGGAATATNEDYAMSNGVSGNNVTIEGNAIVNATGGAATAANEDYAMSVGVRGGDGNTGKVIFTGGAIIARAGMVNGTYGTTNRYAVYAYSLEFKADGAQDAATKIAGAVSGGGVWQNSPGVIVPVTDKEAIGDTIINTPSTGAVIVPDGWNTLSGDSSEPHNVMSIEEYSDNTCCVRSSAAAMNIFSPGGISADAGNTLLAVSLYEGTEDTAGIKGSGEITLGSTGNGSVIAVGGMRTSSNAANSSCGISVAGKLGVSAKTIAIGGARPDEKHSYGIRCGDAITVTGEITAIGGAGYGSGIEGGALTVKATGVITAIGANSGMIGGKSGTGDKIETAGIITAIGGVSGTGRGMQSRTDVSITAGRVVAISSPCTIQSFGVLADRDLSVSGGAEVIAIGSAAPDSYGIRTSAPAAVSGGSGAAIGGSGAFNKQPIFTGVATTGAWGDNMMTWAPAYTVTVNRGTGSGDFGEGAEVTITADAAPSGQRFKEWTTGDGVTFADSTATTTTFSMPNKSVTVTATYKALPIIDPDPGPIPGQQKPTPTPPPTEEPWVNPFTDVGEKDWFYDAVKYCNENGLMDGVSPTEFKPTGVVSRAEVWQVLANLAGVETDTTKAPWYTDAQAWAMSVEITDGTNPLGEVTREQLVTMLYRYAKSKGLITDEGGAMGMAGFEDVTDIASWAYDAFSWAVHTGVIEGSEGRLMPQKSASRAELAEVFMRFDKMR